jgi:hypothetical protein
MTFDFVGCSPVEVIFMRDKFTRYPMHDTRLLLLIALKLAIFADAGI